jgi:hypothetical protein
MARLWFGPLGKKDKLNRIIMEAARRAAKTPVVDDHDAFLCSAFHTVITFFIAFQGRIRRIDCKQYKSLQNIVYIILMNLTFSVHNKNGEISE